MARYRVFAESILEEELLGLRRDCVGYRGDIQASDGI